MIFTRARQWGLRIASAMVVAFGLLCIPDCDPDLPDGGHGQPFLWGQDEIWVELEEGFRRTRDDNCSDDNEGRFAELESNLEAIEARRPGPDDAVWGGLESRFFGLAAHVAACDAGVSRLVALRGRMRQAVRDSARKWPPDRSSRDRVYRLLYGTRIAVEEVMLHASSGTEAALVRGVDEPAYSPSSEVRGVRIRSGDLLLSRGGAPTSAFIARGNDYPGNFSHVALAHVAEDGKVSVIESHIERGVVITDVASYLADKKLRIAVLRLRQDHPALVNNPMLPHRAATLALDEARARHIPYDFVMDFRDPTKMFCSEVASAAYERVGVRLWAQLSTFSSPGLARWMSALGVRHLETQAPSDLEYDPQLRMVAEWRDLDTLYDDHMDNAVIDAMLEQAERGAPLQYDRWRLPAARLAKAYSLLLNAFGAEGPVPEGMSATVALRAQWLERRHAMIKARVVEAARAHQDEFGYRPPYWRLVELAREATETRLGSRWSESTVSGKQEAEGLRIPIAQLASYIRLDQYPGSR